MSPEETRLREGTAQAAARAPINGKAVETEVPYSRGSGNKLVPFDRYADWNVSGCNKFYSSSPTRAVEYLSEV